MRPSSARSIRWGRWASRSASLRKAYFEPVVTGPDGKPVLRPDGTVYTAEVDLFLARDEKGAGWHPSFINGEIEFHGATQEESVAAAAALSGKPERRPPWLGTDLTNAEGVKSRDIPAKGVPAKYQEALAPFRAKNRAVCTSIMNEFNSWADPELRRRMFGP